MACHGAQSTSRAPGLAAGAGPYPYRPKVTSAMAGISGTRFISKSERRDRRRRTTPARTDPARRRAAAAPAPSAIRLAYASAGAESDDRARLLLVQALADVQAATQESQIHEG